MTDPNPPTIDAKHEAEYLRRAANACRFLRNATHHDGDAWFDWVPTHLDRFADRLDPKEADDV